jgi:hypothetical protein
MVLAGGTLGGTAGPLMAGRAFDVTGSYRIAFRVLTLLAVIGFVLNFYFSVKIFQFLPIFFHRPILGTISTKGVRYCKKSGNSSMVSRWWR